MTVLNLNERAGRSGGGNGGTERPILPTDNYRMKIVAAVLEEDQLSKPRKDGTFEEKAVLTWEVSALSAEQAEAAEEAGQEWAGVRVWQRMAPFYGLVREGGPSKFKAFLDGLVGQGLIELDLDNFDLEILVGIEQKVTVQEYIKTMGPNTGKPGNKIVAVSPLRAKKSAKKAADDESDLF